MDGRAGRDSVVLGVVKGGERYSVAVEKVASGLDSHPEPDCSRTVLY